MFSSMFSRRSLFSLPLISAASPYKSNRSQGRIDRERLVRRHNPLIRKVDPFAPLSVGNGEFAFTADVTGLQSFPAEYASGIPLCTQSYWGWHSFPLPAGLDIHGLRLKPFDTHGRQVFYPVQAEGQAELYQWLRENPHRLNLGRIAFRFRLANGSLAQSDDIRELEQILELWSGMLISRYRIGSEKVIVHTCCHPKESAIAVRVESGLIRREALEICYEFPYGSPGIDASDWKQADRHSSVLERPPKGLARIIRQLDATRYAVQISWSQEAVIKESGRHVFTLKPDSDSSIFEFYSRFSPQLSPQKPAAVHRVFAASQAHWRHFWTTGGAVELAGSSDPRAQELERRILLSQYLTAIQCSGSLPPQETGLTCNSWNGKFHLEMHWWHSIHFALWNRLPLLENSLDWYRAILPEARRTAEKQGYSGVRWPKMVGPDGRESPSPIGPLLIWQQPHPIYYAELCYRAHPRKEILQRFREVVFQTADFMASFAYYSKGRDRYVLGPPLIPAQENHAPAETWNAAYELAYWLWGLETAQNWRHRLGMKPNPDWDKVRQKLSPLPVQDGLYLAHENCPETFREKNQDHPSMLAALGVLPGKGVDREIMRRTLFQVMRGWKWETTWGWDYPMVAMTAARLEEPETAVNALLLETPKNRYLPNGHNWQRANLPLYLPGNGGLLAAVAMMAAGWEGGPRRAAPGFPRNGRWQVSAEGLVPML